MGGSYDPNLKDSALACINSGMSIRQCSTCFGIPRKTLSKWRKMALQAAAEGNNNESGGEHEFDKQLVKKA